MLTLVVFRLNKEPRHISYIQERFQKQMHNVLLYDTSIEACVQSLFRRYINSLQPIFFCFCFRVVLRR